MVQAAAFAAHECTGDNKPLFFACREIDATYVSLGLLTNRGLAYEGLYKWKEALKDYDEVLFPLMPSNRNSRPCIRL